jgi:hypothetical protein
MQPEKVYKNIRTKWVVLYLHTQSNAHTKDVYFVSFPYPLCANNFEVIWPISFSLTFSEFHRSAVFPLFQFHVASSCCLIRQFWTPRFRQLFKSSPLATTYHAETVINRYRYKCGGVLKRIYCNFANHFVLKWDENGLDIDICKMRP